MKHTQARWDCAVAVSPLALRWRCPPCGKTAIMKISTLAAVCDCDTTRRVEPEVVSSQPVSFRLDVGRPDHPAPLLGILDDVVAELGRRPGKRLLAQVDEARL